MTRQVPTVEAQGIRSTFGDISAAGVIVFGFSTQDAESSKHVKS